VGALNTTEEVLRKISLSAAAKTTPALHVPPIDSAFVQEAVQKVAKQWQTLQSAY